jgi:adenine-specific DNA-methyltransferase
MAALVSSVLLRKAPQLLAANRNFCLQERRETKCSVVEFTKSPRIDLCAAALMLWRTLVGIPATYVQATPDLMMGDLLKNMRSSQVFSVCGMPEAAVRKLKDGKYEVELLGMDVFDPTTMEVLHRRGDEVPAWFLDTDYNELCFHVSQAFFPKTGAWENLKKALRGDYEETVWDHLAGTVSAPFEAGDHGRVAIKVIDERGNELLIVKSLKVGG